MKIILAVSALAALVCMGACSGTPGAQKYVPCTVTASGSAWHPTMCPISQGQRKFINPSRICNTPIPTGEEGVVVWHLHPAGPKSQPTAPVRSQLPAPQPGPKWYAAARYVETSASCDEGAVVEVTPKTNAQLVMDVQAKDGKIAGLGIMVTGPVTIRAWVGNQFQGSITFSPSQARPVSGG